jgi:predicted ATPase with chaperone activity
MLARRLTTILPAMTLAEATETTRVHRVAGLTGAGTLNVRALELDGLRQCRHRTLHWASC